LLVFEHVDYPDAGIQVPAGSVDPGEDLNQAVLREAREETGLKDLKIESLLGDKEYLFVPAGDEGVNIHRYFFHLSYPGPIERDSWQHWESNPSDGPDDKLLFELYWIEMTDELPDLIGGLGDMLDKLIE
jgi:8-oxo-dGTP pyrophosphatase MutT (NUDIX family)